MTHVVKNVYFDEPGIRETVRKVKNTMLSVVSRQFGMQDIEFHRIFKNRIGLGF